MNVPSVEYSRMFPPVIAIAQLLWSLILVMQLLTFIWTWWLLTIINRV